MNLRHGTLSTGKEGLSVPFFMGLEPDNDLKHIFSIKSVRIYENSQDVYQ